MKQRSPITTHILDLSLGKAAVKVPVTLEMQGKGADANQWWEVARSVTDADGRIEEWLAAGSKADAGIYRLTFDTQSYFKFQGSECFYPNVTVAFRLSDPARHHHIPLLLSPFGYSTYRGT